MSALDDNRWTTSDTVALVLFFPFAFGGFALRGWAVAKLWLWFIVPLGAAPLSVVGAIGLSLLATTLTSHIQPKEADKTLLVRVVAMGAQSAFFSLTPVAVGWLARCFS